MDAELSTLLAQLRDPNLRFPARPAFAGDLDMFEMPDGLGFQVRGGETPVIVRGRTVAPVIEFLRARLDGRTRLEELLGDCPPEIGASTLVRSLLLLHGKGILVEGGEEPSTEIVDPVRRRQLLYWGRHLDLTRGAGSSREVARRLARADVALVATGLFGAATFDLLARSGVTRCRVLAWDDDGFLEETASDAPVAPLELVRVKTTNVDGALEILRGWISDVDLLVTATCDAPNSLFRSINSLCLHARRPWLRGNGDGSAVDVGPLVHPFESSCFTCLELRTGSAEGFAIENALYQARLAVEREAGSRAVVGEELWAATMAASILVGESFRLLTGLAPATLVDSVLRLTPVTGVIEQNHVKRVPRCPDCYRGGITPQRVDVAASLLGTEA